LFSSCLSTQNPVSFSASSRYHLDLRSGQVFFYTHAKQLGDQSGKRTMNSLELQLEEFIRCHHLLEPKQSVLLAVSGGVDSMAILHLFAAIQERMQLQLSIVHVNHQLRGDESLEDERFVQEKSVVYNVPFYCERVDVIDYATNHGLSKQAAARQLRYTCFERVRCQVGAHAIVTAHHADDNAETLLLNILRGTGIHGLAGIPLKRSDGHIIRPLLFATRGQIEQYVSEHSIQYRNDSSNESLVYRRNFLRHNIIPILMNRTPHLVATLNEIAGIMRDVSEHVRMIVDEALSSLVYQDAQDRWTLKVKGLAAKPDFLWDEIFIELLRRLYIEPTEKKVDALHKLTTLPTGRIVELGEEFSAWKDRNQIVFIKRSENASGIQMVEFGGSYEYQGCRISVGRPEPVPAIFTGTKEAEYIDAGCLGKQLVLRPWRAGDWFIPLGMKTKKKLSDYFTDQKVPRFTKKDIPVLESDGAIVWVCGQQLDDRFKLTGKTRSAIQLMYLCQPR
jgi:tRNA(Ile)-lysidine synthase